MLYLLTFRGFATIAMPTNCVLSAKIIVLREKRSTTQEKTSNSAKPLLVLRRVWKLYFVNLFGFSFRFLFSISFSSTAIFQRKILETFFKFNNSTQHFSRKLFQFHFVTFDFSTKTFPRQNFQIQQFNATLFTQTFFSKTLIENWKIMVKFCADFCAEY